MKIETWKDLKEFANSLKEGQLKHPVRYWGEEEGGTIANVEVLDEDYINPSGEGVERKSLYADEPEYEDEEVILEKETPMLVINY